MKLHPYTHRAKTPILIPSTKHVVEAYPNFVRYGDKTLALDIQGPIKNFTVMQDLERVCVTIFSDLYRFHILPSLEVVHSKSPKTPPVVHEILDFGMHKKQEWELLRKRVDFRELLPIWYRMGSLLNLPTIECGSEGMFSLLHAASQASSDQVLSLLQTLYIAGFSEGFVPRSDDEHQGIISEISTTDPLYLLYEGAKLIRSFFVEANDDSLSVLPKCPPELFAGKFLGIQVPFGSLDLVWSNKRLKTVTIYPSSSVKLKIKFPAGFKKFRLKNTFHSCLNPLEINANEEYHLDRFQK